ncbi:hypothetical protein BerOc1_03738 [Pseudodesulfovibrio hydrargyri]|uniref:Lipoprotein n=1 Tax=Pseudodesulfovibrio hydrargyri TaxID=2125990 RepID=A0A1J5MSY7_9BACT|nr:hypothetical protein [Pseudodesulfovibrio hydrargyri]OIQ48980.1 hypothetical protein BerOc1_03738 [Pseudodesulfovibrio hydrargyri]
MRKSVAATTLLLFALAVLAGCALGRKQWPEATRSEDRFNLKLMDGERIDDCLVLRVGVSGAVERLWRASVLYEPVGDEEGQGCVGCPFVPREAKHFTRDQQGFDLQGNVLKLGICGLEPGVEYRFQVSGKSEIPTMRMQYTDVYMAEP